MCLGCRYVPGQQGAAKVILALRQGWKGLRQFPLLPDRAALVVSAGLLLPYSTPDFATSLSKAWFPRLYLPNSFSRLIWGGMDLEEVLFQLILPLQACLEGQVD